MEETEIWKPIPGYEGYYEVSSYGRVRSVDRTIRTASGELRRHVGQILKFEVDKDNYRRVGLFRGGLRSRQRVHRLVALVFCGKPSEGQEVRHLDGDPANNRVENLRWGSQSENRQDSVAHGTSVHFLPGQGHPSSKLSANQVREIRELYATRDIPQWQIGERFGIARGTVSNIVRRKAWKHI